MRNRSNLIGSIVLVMILLTMLIFTLATCSNPSGEGGGGDVDKLLTSITVDWTALKNFGIGEPLNSAEKVWTITATFDDASTQTIQNNIAGLTWDPPDFSATAGSNKTVTVSYGGQSAVITGINVLTLNERVAAVADGAIVTINLYADETINASININSNRNIELKGVDSERMIKNNCYANIFALQNYAQLTFGENITLQSIAASHEAAAVVFFGVSSTFTMKNNSKITGHKNNVPNGAGAAVACGMGGMTLDLFNAIVIEGGEISGNSTAGYGAGIYIIDGAILTINGGKIESNISDIYGNDVHILGDVPPINISGKAQIGQLSLYAYNNSDRRGKITVASNFTGSVTSLDLVTKDNWTTSIVPFILPEAGQTLTKELLDKFTLGNFLSSSFPYPSEPITPGYHLYGTKSGEINPDNFGKLVAD